MSVRNPNRTTETAFYALIQTAKSRGGLDYPRRIDYLGTFTDGTRYMVEYGSRDLEFYLVTDLTTPERRVFQGTGTIAINAMSASIIINFTPLLLDSVLTNYRIFAFVDQASETTGVVLSAIVSTTGRLIVRVGRIASTNQSLAKTTGLTVAGTTLTEDDTAVATAHGAVTSVQSHGHEAAGIHPVTDPGHFHTNLDASAALTLTVDCLVWHV